MVSIKHLIETNTRLEMNTTHAIKALRLELLDALRKPSTKSSASPLAGIGDKLTELSREGVLVEKQQTILGSLNFQGMRWRYSAIKKEHEETFRWIFKNADTKFLDWLKSGDGIYWIEGKAGSGKSTLMKYLLNVDLTRAALNDWAGQNRLFVASYFFWAAGNPMQRSQEGLFRTLLFQILRKCPDLIPSVCSERWDETQTYYSGPWDCDELVRTLDLLAKQTLSHAKFCFFVDGMDEFIGDQRALIEILKRLAISLPIKLCVSSRPWNVFVNAFDGHVPQLKLETLTKDDIQKYVEDKLGNGHMGMEWDTTTHMEIVTEITTRARGVFLWVYLVVDSLLKGQEEGDDIKDVRRRLDSIPDDLEEFFKRIISTIDRFYREETTKIFLVTIQAGQPLPALAFEYLEQERSDEHHALKTDITPISDPEVKRISEKMKKRINARCRDLLEIRVDPDEALFYKYQVDFLHRTVRDFFLRTTAMDDILKPEMKASFDPALSLCRIMLALTKAIPKTTPLEERSDLISQLADQMLGYALQLEAQHIHESKPNRQILNEYNLLNDLDRVNTEHMMGRRPHIHWTAAQLNPSGLGRPTSVSLAKYETTFLDLATRRGLVLYLRHKLANNPKLLRNSRGRPYLYYALHPIMIDRSMLPNHEINPGIEVLRFFLEEKHLSPNEKAGRSTVWSHFISGIYANKSQYLGYSQEHTCDVIKLLLRNGADPYALCSADSSDLPAIDILRKVLPTEAGGFEDIMRSKSLLALERQPQRKKSPIRALFRKFLSRD